MRALFSQNIVPISIFSRYTSVEIVPVEHLRSRERQGYTRPSERAGASWVFLLHPHPPYSIHPIPLLARSSYISHHIPFTHPLPLSPHHTSSDTRSSSSHIFELIPYVPSCIPLHRQRLSHCKYLIIIIHSL